MLRPERRPSVKPHLGVRPNLFSLLKMVPNDISFSIWWRLSVRDPRPDHVCLLYSAQLRLTLEARLLLLRGMPGCASRGHTCSREPSVSAALPAVHSGSPGPQQRPPREQRGSPEHVHAHSWTCPRLHARAHERTRMDPNTRLHTDECAHTQAPPACGPAFKYTRRHRGTRTRPRHVTRRPQGHELPDTAA